MTADTSLSRTDGVRWLLMGYLVVLGLLVFLPFGRAMDLGDRLNLDPLATIERALELGPRSPSFRLMIGNIAAFVPFGLLLPLASRSLRSPIVVLVCAIALSAAIELGQLAVSVGLGYAYRSTDVDDVILNVLGALVGYVLFLGTALLAAIRR
jgi:glycopeptide antibiotics resistance protein